MTSKYQRPLRAKFKTIADRFLKDPRHAWRDTTLAGYQIIVARLNQVFGEMMIQDINRDLIEVYLNVYCCGQELEMSYKELFPQQLEKCYSDSTREKNRALLKQIFDYIDTRYNLKKHPLKNRLRLVKSQGKPETRTYSKKVITQLESHPDNHACLLMKIAMATGMRPSELIALQFSDFHDDTIEITKSSPNGIDEPTKTSGSTRKILLNGHASQIIKRLMSWPKNTSDLSSRTPSFIFSPSPSNNKLRFQSTKQLYRYLKSEFKKLGISYIGVQPCRATFITEALKAISIEELALYVGHTSPKMIRKHYLSPLSNVHGKKYENALNGLFEMVT